jgi:hypothetical protein
VRHFDADSAAVAQFRSREFDIRNRDRDLLPLVVIRENEVLRLDETFALVELGVFRTVVRQLVAVEQPVQGDRAWVNDLRRALELAESVDCALADQDSLSSGHPRPYRTIYIMLSNGNA